MNLPHYFEKLDLQTQELIQLAAHCSDEQLHFIKGENWSILQILEHIIMTENIVISLLLRPADTLAETPELFGAEKLHHLVVTKRGEKLMAPEVLHPRGEITSAEDFAKTFRQQRSLLRDNISSGIIVIDNRTFKHPYLGAMTITDWLHFFPAHTQRHIEQIKDIISLTETFPVSGTSD